MTATSSWRERAGTTFAVAKAPVTARDGMVVANHPLAAAAGVEMLAAGGNAIDAAVATLFTLSIVEPMMVGILGGGLAHIRLADGSHRIIDGLSTVPRAGHAGMYTPLDNGIPFSLETVGRQNAVGARAVGSFGTLKGWCEAQARFGKLSLADVLEPAIRHAARGFAATPYLCECIAEASADLERDKTIARVFLSGGTPLRAGARLVQGAAADSLSVIAKEGPGALYTGALGRAVVAHLRRGGSLLDQDDLVHYATVERTPVRGNYRGHEIVGPPPPSSGGVHVIQMLNTLAERDVSALGFGTADGLHLLAEVLKIAFADRAVATADPAFVSVPVARLISRDYARERHAAIDMARAQVWSAGVVPGQSPHTTHVTVADRDGNIVASTQTINSTFGARIMIPDLGLIPNNYMYLFDPRPGRSLSIAPDKRVTTSMSPIIALKDGMPAFALGLPGGLRIFGSAMQAIVNLLDHGMSLQEAVEAPRLWTQGDVVEVEDAMAELSRSALAARGHKVQAMPHVAGGMNAIGFAADGTMTGAACWRADGTAIGYSGGRARAGVRFWPDQPGRRS